MGFTNFTAKNNSGIPSVPNMPIGNSPAASGVDPMDMLLNYNAMFISAGPAMFREEVTQQTLSVLIGKNKPNALLVGPAGTGKTKIVEDIAYKLANDDPILPDKLRGCTIYELPISNIVSGSSYVGQVEEKLTAVLDFIADKANKAILFLDEVHRLVDSSHPTYEKIAQILKPALARGNLRCIGATTTQEAKELMNDPAFNRRFSKIIVDELTKAQTTQILLAAKPDFMAHHCHKIAISDELLPVVTELADEYHPAGSHRPDNALTLLDRTIGDAVVNRKRQEVILSTDPSAKQALLALQSVKQIPITEKQARQTAIRLATGNSKPDALDVEKLKSALSAIKGQDTVIAHLILELRKHEMNLIPSRQPMTMLFIGPSGVGKTEVTKIIAKELTGCAPVILNMTEYNSPASVNRIIGSPAGYVGFNSHAELPFDCLESNPYQIILLDEFEKCDDSVKKLFMQVFDEGTLKTNRGTTVDFSKSMIIATTNAGYAESKATLGFASDGSALKSASVKDLSLYFEIALLNRFKDRVSFKEIDRETYREILVAKYKTILKKIRVSKPRIQLPEEIPDNVLDTLVETSYIPEFGARPARKTVEDWIYKQIL